MDNQTNNKDMLYTRIRAIREGDQKAFGELLSEYTPLLLSEVLRHGASLSEQDQEDLRQIASVALYRAALAFDLEQSEVAFGLYAKICISNALVSQLRVIRRRVPEISTEMVAPVQEPSEDPARRVMEQEAYALLYARIRSLLSPYENRVWSLFVAGRSTKEIATLLEKDAHSIENAVYRIRQKLRAALGDGARS